MCSINQFRKRIAERDDGAIAQKAILNSKQEFIIQQEYQMYASKTNKGQLIEPPYTPAYRNWKISKFGQSGLVTLFVTGDFYAGFDLKVSTTTFEAYSKDYKNPWLTKRYKDIWGLGGMYRHAYFKAPDGLQIMLVREYKKAFGLL